MRLRTKIIAIVSMFSSFSALACGPPVAGVAPPGAPIFGTGKTDQSPTKVGGNNIWKQCWQSVEVHSFSGSALRDLDNLKLNYQQKYHAALLAQMMEASQNKMTAMKSGYESLLQILNENYAAVLEARTQMKTQMLEMELDYMRDLQEKKMNEEHQGFFNDENGEDGSVRADTQSYTYFKSVCKRNKMFNKTSSAVYQEKRNLKVNKQIVEKTRQMTAVTGNSNAVAQSVLLTHKSGYCSAEEIKYELCDNPELKLCVADDIDSGVCYASNNEIFELEAKDVDALNFLQPDGFDGRYTYDGTELEKPTNKIEDELFTVKETYTPEQEQAARDFASLLIYQSGVKAPSVNEKDAAMTQEFVSHYNRYLSNLNLANYSFQNAIESRKPITEGEIKMSERDIMRYIIHNLKDPDVNSATMAAKDKGQDLMIYQLMTVNNKLRVENDEIKERIVNLLAALVAQSANDPTLLESLEDLK